MPEKFNNKANYAGFDMNSNQSGKKRVKSSWGNKFFMLILVLIGIYFLYLGLTLFLGNADDDYAREDVYGLLTMVVSGMGYFFYYLPKYSNYKKRIIHYIIFVIIVNLIFYSLGNFLLAPISILVGFSSLAIGLILLFNFIRLIRDGNFSFHPLFWGFIYLLFGFLLMAPYGKERFITLLGLYLIFLGYNFLKEALSSLFNFRNKKKERKRKLITLPTFISAFFPIGFFSQINNRIENIDSSDNKDLFTEIEGEDDKTEDLVVYIHTRAGLIPGFGHVDISFDNKVYCYGNYDEDTWIFGGFLSDGVMVTTTPSNHINNALNNDKKILIAYTLKISEKTKEKIQKQIDKIMEKSYVWQPKAELAETGQIEGPPEKYTDCGSLMYLNEKTKLYKFKKGSPYKTYYLLGQNCAMFANDIIGHSGIKLVRLNRIVTPGTYLEYLNELFMMNHTIVVDRKIYMLNQNGKPYLLNKNQENEIKAKIA